MTQSLKKTDKQNESSDHLNAVLSFVHKGDKQSEKREKDWKNVEGMRVEYLEL